MLSRNFTAILIIMFFPASIFSTHLHQKIVKITSERSEIPKYVAIGAEKDIGKRKEMQDCFLTEKYQESDNNIFFSAVLDGHGCQGDTAAIFARDNIFDCLLKSPDYKRGNITEGLTDAFNSLNQKFYNEYIAASTTSGTCVAAAFIKGNKLFLANLGDCRAILVDVDGKICAETKDHKTTEKSEFNRLKTIPKVDMENDRIQGILAPTRVIGDFKFRKYVLDVPDIYEIDLDRKYSFLILATDGIWSVISSEEAANIVGATFKSYNTTSSDAAKDLKDLAIEKNSLDNISVIVIQFIWN